MPSGFITSGPPTDTYIFLPGVVTFPDADSMYVVLGFKVTSPKNPPLYPLK